MHSVLQMRGHWPAWEDEWDAVLETPHLTSGRESHSSPRGQFQAFGAQMRRSWGCMHVWAREGC
jgi:hypothetical protein